jgi:hypothetical protein
LRIVLAICLALMASPAFADHERFMVGKMQNADPSASGITSASGACVPSHDRENLKCYFTSFTLWQVKRAEKAKTELDELTREMSHLSTARLGELTASFCADKKMRTPDAVLMKYNVAYRALATSLKAFCERPNSETALSMLRVMVESDARKCNCAVTDWRSTFVRQHDRWVSTSGPTGLCGVITVFTLVPYDLTKMREPLGPTLWTLHQKTVTTHDSDSTLCAKGPFRIEEGSLTMSWNAPVKTLDCQEVEFITSLLEGMTDPTRR